MWVGGVRGQEGKTELGFLPFLKHKGGINTKVCGVTHFVILQAFEYLLHLHTENQVIIKYFASVREGCGKQVTCDTEPARTGTRP